MTTPPEDDHASPHELRQAAIAFSCWVDSYARGARGEHHDLYHLLHCPGGPALHDTAVRLMCADRLIGDHTC